MKPNYISIGARLKEARKFNKLTQQKLADMMGVSVSYVKNTERGGKPSIEYLLVVADKCHVSIDWLLTGVENNLDDQTQTLKKETVFYPDLKMMIDILTNIMQGDDPDLRTWAKVQFKKAFAEYCTAEGK